MRSLTQRSLFNTPTFNIAVDLKVVMNGSAKKCGMSRDEIVDDMNALADRYGVRLVKGNGRYLTIGTLEKWLNPADLTRQIPAKAIPIFNAVVGSGTTLEILCKPTGHKMIGPEDQRLLEWARAYQNARVARKTMRKLEPEI